MINDIDVPKLVADFNAKNLPKTCWQIAFGFEIFAESFGMNFIQREFLNGKRELSFTNIDDPFFFELSDLLWRLKDCKGFPEFIEREKTKSKEPLFYGLHCASMLLCISKEIEFNLPTGVKGQDYDLLANNCMGFEHFSVEVKARTREFNNERAVVNFLKEAIKQLPKKNNAKNGSAIMFKIIIPNTSFSQVGLERTIRKVILSTTRISHIIYFWSLNKTLENGKRIVSFYYRCIDDSGLVNDDIFPLTIRNNASYMKGLYKLPI